MSLKFCSLSSGSNGNCYVVKTDDQLILIDAGIALKKIEEKLSETSYSFKEISAVLITHEHADHIKSAGAVSRKYDIPVYANEKTWIEMEKLIGTVKEKNKKIFKTGEIFNLSDLTVKSFSTPHDAADPVGFSLYNEDAQLSIVTDIGYVTEDILKEIIFADLLVLEANHDVNMLKIGKYPWFLKQRILGKYGHLSNEDAGKTLISLLTKHPKVRQVLLAHLSRENNFPQMAYQTVKNILEEKSYYIGRHIMLNTIIREEVSAVYSVKKQGGIRYGI